MGIDLKKIGLIIVGVSLVLGMTACGKENEEMNEIKVSGPLYMYAPNAGEGQSFSEKFCVTETKKGKESVLENVTWEVMSEVGGVSINDGVVSIDETYLSGDINGTDVTLKATFSLDGKTDKEEVFSLHVREAMAVKDFTIELNDAISASSQNPVSVSNMINQYDEVIPEEKLRFLPEIDWDFSVESLKIEDGKLCANLSTNEPVAAAIRASVDGVSVEKRFYIVPDEKYVLSDEEIKALCEGASPFESVKKIYDFERMLDNDKYIYVNANLNGAKELKVDVKNMENYSANALYQVALRKDGAVEIIDMVPDADGFITVNTENCDALEVTPVFIYQFGLIGPKNVVPEHAVVFDTRTTYDGTNNAGFCGRIDDSIAAVSFKEADACFVLAVPNGFYNVRITKGGTGRSSVLINGAPLGANVGIGGTGGREGTTPYYYYMEDVKVSKGTLRVGLGEKDFALAAVEIRRATTLSERRVHIYIGGDSTTAAYYPIETKEPAPGRAQTGWGQVFAQYVTDDVAVTNIGSGGTYAKSWYELYMQGVLQNGMPGDYFLIQEGINDQSYSNVEEMTEYLSKMIDECREKGIIPVLVTSMQTAKFWKDKNGTDLPEFGKPEGSGKYAFAEGMRKLAKEKNVFIADAALETTELFGRLGYTFVLQNFHLYNKSKKGAEVEDTLHLSYAGAMNMAGTVATSLFKAKESDLKDATGATLDGIVFNEMGSVNYEITDENDKSKIETVERVTAIYERYAQ